MDWPTRRWQLAAPFNRRFTTALLHIVVASLLGLSVAVLGAIPLTFAIALLVGRSGAQGPAGLVFSIPLGGLIALAYLASLPFLDNGKRRCLLVGAGLVIVVLIVGHIPLDLMLVG